MAAELETGTQQYERLDRRTILAGQLEQEVLQAVAAINSGGEFATALRRTAHMNPLGDRSILVLFNSAHDRGSNVRGVKVIPLANNKTVIAYTLGQNWQTTQDMPMMEHLGLRIKDGQRLAGVTATLPFYNEETNAMEHVLVGDIVTAGFFVPIQMQQPQA